MCSGRRYGSTVMQHDVFGSGHQLDLRLNFQHDLLRCNFSSFDASWQGKRNAGKINVMPLLSQKSLKKDIFRKNGYFLVLLSGYQTVYHLSTQRKTAIECAFPLRCSSSDSRVMRRFVEKCWKSKISTFEFWWPLVSWPEKMNEAVSSLFLCSFECRLLRVATWTRSRVRGGCLNTPRAGAFGAEHRFKESSPSIWDFELW